MRLMMSLRSPSSRSTSSAFSESDHWAGPSGPSKTERFQLAHPADLDPVEIFLALARLRPQIDHAAMRRRIAGEHPIQPGPALRPDLGLQRMPDFPVGSGAKLQSQQLLRPRPHSFPDIVARDDEILVIVGPAPDNDMDVGMLGIPVIDGDPVEAGAQVAFGVGHEVAGESFDIREFAGVFGRDNEPEMMPVLLAPLSESLMIDIIALSAEHPGRIAILGHAVAAEIGEMGGKRRALHAMTHDPGFDHRDARPVGQILVSPRGSRRGPGRRLPLELDDDDRARHPAGSFGGGERLGNEWLGALAPGRSGPPRPDAKIVIPFHGALTRKVCSSQSSQRIIAFNKVMAAMRTFATNIVVP